MNLNNIVKQTGKYDHLITHDNKNIKGFFRDYRWMSNFHRCDVEYEGLIYPSSENAYQAAKVVESDRNGFLKCTPSESKHLWKSKKLLHKSAEEWDDAKLDIMRSVLVSKFTRNKELGNALVETAPKYLEESLNWHDIYWGKCYCETHKGDGESYLGKLLMEIRDSIISVNYIH